MNKEMSNIIKQINPNNDDMLNKQRNYFSKKTLPKGILIAFMGQDGAGKSTVTDDITEWLVWKIEAKKFYLGSGDHYHSWMKSIRNKLPDKKNRLQLGVSAILGLWDSIALAKRTKKIIVNAKRYAYNGGVAIFDRYPQVTYYGINDGPKIRENFLSRVENPVLRKYILHCAKVEEKYLIEATSIEPDIVFKLLLPPEVSIERKPEENLENVRAKHEIIKSLQFENALTYTIDATQNYDDELLLIKQYIWNKFVHQKCEG